MIGTLSIKPEQLLHGTYKTGSGPDVILIMGSCRSVPYLNHFHELNRDNRFTIHYLDPFNWNWDLNDQRVDYHMAIGLMESHPELRKTLESTKWFIHEHYQNFGMFNTNRSKEKHIYQFGLQPQLDICIPNFHDVFILFQDFIKFDQGLKDMAHQDLAHFKVLTDVTQAEVMKRALENIEKYYSLCSMTSFPEMADIFRNHWRTIRYFWSFNHVSAEYTTQIMRLMNEKFLKLDIPQSLEEFWIRNDMFKNIVTPLTKYDIANYHILWDDPVVPLEVN